MLTSKEQKLRHLEQLHAAATKLRRPFVESAMDEAMPPNNDPTVLVVEDEPLVRRMATVIIENAGWNVIAASDSDETLNLLAVHPEVTVLFTDTELRGRRDGIALSAHVHDARPDIELVVTRSGDQYPSGGCRTKVRFFKNRTASGLSSAYCVRSCVELGQ